MDNDEAANRRTSARLQGRSHPKTYKSDEEDQVEEIPDKRRAISKQREKSSDQHAINTEIVLSDGSDIEDDEHESIEDELGSEELEDRPESSNEHDYFSMLASREAGFFEDEELNDNIQIPASLLFALNQKDSRQTNKDEHTEAEKRVFQILESVPTRQEIEDNPSLKMPARRKPYDRLNPQVHSSTTHNPPILPKRLQETSPTLNLNELSTMECPEEVEMKSGINLISVPISQTDKKYTRIEPDDEDLPAEVEILWPNSVDQLVNPCLEPQHQCPMVDYLREKIHDSKLQTKRAWETVREILQQAREKEHLIRQLKMNLHDERHTGGLPESLVKALKESRGMSSYVTMSSASRHNAEYVFQLILQQAFPNFNEKDIKNIFIESARLSGNNIPQVKYGYISSEISSNIAKLEKRLDTSNEKNLPIIANNRPTIQINQANHSIKNVAPLAVIEPKFGSTVITPQLVPKRMTFADKARANSDRTKLREAKMRERDILKTHPTKQYIPEKRRLSNKKMKQSLPLIGPPAPTLVRKFPTTPQLVRMPNRTLNSNPRQSALEFAIQQRASSLLDPKRSIPIKPPGQRITVHKSQGAEGWKTFVTRRNLPVVRPSTSSEYVHRLPTSSELLARMASSTEIAQKENKRRLEALCPVKTEPIDYD